MLTLPEQAGLFDKSLVVSDCDDAFDLLLLLVLVRHSRASASGGCCAPFLEGGKELSARFLMLFTARALLLRLSKDVAMLLTLV
jgi:hypothetical protein